MSTPPFVTTSSDATEQLGAALGAHLQPGDVVALIGDLGAGKTYLTRGIARGLGIAEPVTSPTFILVAEYSTASGFTFYHADCYRLDATHGVAEALAIGLDELLNGDGVAVVEWADRIAALLPPDHLRVELTVLDDTRRALTFTAHGPRAATLLNTVSNDL